MVSEYYAIIPFENKESAEDFFNKVEYRGTVVKGDVLNVAGEKDEN